MIRYTVQLFGITIFALAMIWHFGSGEAANRDNQIWADTTHIDVEIPPKTMDTDENSRDTFLRDIRSLTNTAYEIRSRYMEDVNSDDIINAGIRGMLENLDRYSVLMEEDEYESLMEQTRGKYEGLGMQIDSRDDRIVIISPIEGTPAYRKGLRAGDIIMKIDTVDTEGLTTSEGADLMRGPAGTSVKLMIKRAGIADVMEFDVERAVIELKSVNYSGVIQGTDIGYVRLNRFAEETSHELREAITELNNDSVSALILDLRSNGGGLLDQAKETAELFLKQYSEIVSTRGKDPSSETHLYSERPPIFPDKPLVILVNEGTASASEIVSGAIQDWDRGVVMGRTTYGKGLVQRLFPITPDGSKHLKLTTARYYVPSGRCIQKPERQAKHGSQAEADLEAGSDSLETRKKEVYYTNGGRIVYGGGGIVPDIEVEADYLTPIEINLERQSMFFDFAVKWLADHPMSDINFEVTDEMVAAFKKFTQERDFDYKTSMQVALEDLTETINDEEKLDLFQPTLDSLSSLIEAQKDEDFKKSNDYIKRAIKREILSSIGGQKGMYEGLVLKTDPAVLKAIELLEHPGEYTELITEGRKDVAKAEVTNEE
ncbi:MAG TPA: S41 family peptidase [candidate division Zixibacteria bacterium]|nr:S41 family peptidase [candidate division Zixibacteria bacterium]